MSHHSLSMSKWPMWEQCPCAAPSADETEEARSGTRSHSWLSYLIDSAMNGLQTLAPEGVTADEKARAEWAFGQICAIAGSYHVSSERHVRISDPSASPSVNGIEGTADAVAILPDRILVADYKTYSTNPCDLSAQLMGYAYAVATEEPFAPQDVEIVILHGGSREVERKRTTVAECRARADEIIMRHIQHIDDTDCAAPNHFCRYCARLKTCPGADRALAVVNDESRFMSMPLAQQLVVAKQVKSICERVEQSVKDSLDAQIEAGTPVEEAEVSGGGVTWRYRLKPGRDALSDICGLANECSKHGLDNEGLMRLCAVPKTRLCDALLAVNPGMSAAAAGRLIKPFYAPGKPSKYLERVA